MSKITAYSPDTTPSLDDLIVTVDIGNGNKKVTLQDLADAIAPSIGTTLESNGGWVEETEIPDTITYNGNRNYTLVFNSADLTDTLSEGMKLRLTRTVSAPAQCADLEASSSQYFNDTSVSGTTFTDDFNTGSWIKLESYTQGAIISRYNGTSGWVMDVNTTGQIRLLGYNAGSGNVSYVQCYQAIPLGKWTHVCAELDMSAFTATSTTSYVMIDGVDVPCSVSRAGTNPTALVQAGDLNVGASNSTSFFDGKLAQTFYSSAKITQSNVRTLITQGLTASLISTHSIVSAYSFDNTLNDLNTTTANNLSAQNSAAATNVDSPFGNYLGGTLEYAVASAKPIFSTNTTVTVQVPEGCAIPTSGGVSAVAYSTQDTPYLFPKDDEQWEVLVLLKTQQSTGLIASSATVTNVAGMYIDLPISAGELSFEIFGQMTASSVANMKMRMGLSTANTSYSDGELVCVSTLIAPASVEVDSHLQRTKKLKIDAATKYYLNTQSDGIANTTQYYNGTVGTGVIRWLPKV